MRCDIVARFRNAIIKDSLLISTSAKIHDLKVLSVNQALNRTNRYCYLHITVVELKIKYKIKFKSYVLAIYAEKRMTLLSSECLALKKKYK